jgi:endonuclease/exonuclease/phosphatase family metal-dependent hydrolase
MSRTANRPDLEWRSPLIRERPRLVASLGFGAYIAAGLMVTGLPANPVPVGAGGCSAPLLGTPETDSPPSLRVLQGNAWMLPERPLLLPYSFSVERRERLERIVRTVRACQPDVVLLQEVFEARLVDVLARSLPDYTVYTSSATDVTGTVNASGLVTLARVPVEAVRFHAFADLSSDAQAVERLGRKGFLGVTVDAGGFYGEVVNLHLYAFRDPSDARHTLAQLEEVLAHARAARAQGRVVLVGGDFNLDRAQLERAAPDWVLSEHGPTFDPIENAYATAGVNEGSAGRASDARVRTIDYLLTSTTSAVSVRSAVLRDLALSDHYFLAHRVDAPGRPAQ